ncbi:hypothetical protein ColTof4_12436 [Colletotrichum tofieldiae]|nr:hypothetical protein ColTof3_06612 [Colletotrichum tofieldiae]GKT80013.1 hypothetical protein ColTof4_12436 [Colletotrichum tofieldiae]
MTVLHFTLRLAASGARETHGPTYDGGGGVDEDVGEGVDEQERGRNGRRWMRRAPEADDDGKQARRAGMQITETRASLWGRG